MHMVMPTWNNSHMCSEAVRTLYEFTDYDKYGSLCVWDNSPAEDLKLQAACDKYGVEYFHSSENLGWMRSINAGYTQGKNMDLFTMCNDDVIFPQDPDFWPRVFNAFDDPAVGGVGPVSNYVMGVQYYQAQVEGQIGLVPFLIGFCATYRVSAIDKVGLLDIDLPGGDDLDYSIRMKAAGYKLVCDRRNFLYHYGSVTGNRVHSDWDSLQAQMKTTNALIRKHGFKTWYECVSGKWESLDRPGGKVNDIIAREVSDLCGYVVKQGAEIYEGSSTLPELAFLYEQAAEAKTVCEIGFNSGMSACAMLLAGAAVYSFDEGKWSCVQPAVDYLENRFHGRFHMLPYGDSTLTVPMFLRDFPEITFDLALVDGGHDYETALADIVNLSPRSRKMVIDDSQMPGVLRAISKASELGYISNIQRFNDTSAQMPRYWVLCNGKAQ